MNIQIEYDEKPDKEQDYIIIYDFLGFKGSKRFWENLHRISDNNPESGLIQYSV